MTSAVLSGGSCDRDITFTKATVLFCHPVEPEQPVAEVNAGQRPTSYSGKPQFSVVSHQMASPWGRPSPFVVCPAAERLFIASGEIIADREDSDY
jgi:hypothetical protein